MQVFSHQMTDNPQIGMVRDTWPIFKFGGLIGKW